LIGEGDPVIASSRALQRSHLDQRQREQPDVARRSLKRQHDRRIGERAVGRQGRTRAKKKNSDGSS
jgi:hypothetical protein